MIRPVALASHLSVKNFTPKSVLSFFAYLKKAHPKFNLKGNKTYLKYKCYRLN